jgi:phosphoglycolate phosphatase
MTKHILFDFDGTLIDSAPYVLTAYKQAFAEYDITPKVAITESIIGPPLIATIEMLIGEDNPTLVQQLADKFMELYDGGVAENTFFYDGVGTMLNRFKEQGYQLHIATNKRYKPTEAILKHLGFFDTFTEVRAVDQLPEGKRSKAQLIKEIMAKHAIAIEDAIYVGDKLDDFNAADANEVKFVAAGWGYGDWDAPFTILNSAQELNNFTTSLWSNT